MAIEKNIVDKQIGKFGRFNKWLSRPECGHLHEIMNHGEEIKAITAGYYEGHNWLITITSQRLIFLRQKNLTEFFQTFLPLAEIKTISFSSGFKFGQFDFKTISGDKKIDMLEKKDVMLLSSLLTELLSTFR